MSLSNGSFCVDERSLSLCLWHWEYREIEPGITNDIFKYDKVYLQPKQEYFLRLRDITVANNFRFSFNHSNLSQVGLEYHLIKNKS